MVSDKIFYPVYYFDWDIHACRINVFSFRYTICHRYSGWGSISLIIVIALLILFVIPIIITYKLVIKESNIFNVY